jgi:hypothetical protein
MTQPRSRASSSTTIVIAAATTLMQVLTGCASVNEHALHDHADRPLPANTEVAHKCRAGAFVDASNIVNSVVEIAMALPPNTPDRTRAELDTVLYTALRQANSEVHCVAGALSYGYERSYAGVIRRGVALAQSRRLSADIIELGNKVVATLESNRRVAPSSARAADNGDDPGAAIKP